MKWIIYLTFLIIFVGCQNNDFVGKQFLTLDKQPSRPRPKAPSNPSHNDPDDEDPPGGSTGGGASSGLIQVKAIRNNPVFVAKQSVGYRVSSGSSSPASAINFDPYVSTYSFVHNSNILKSSDIDVRPDMNGAISRVTADSQGNFLYSTIDPSRSNKIDPKHKFGQVMAYYWINQEKNHMSSIIPDSWAPTGKNIKVYSYCADAEYNAYWDTDNNLVCMGYVGAFEAAYDASVYAHEMGHANIDYGTRGAIHSHSNDRVCRDSSGDGFYCCQTADGCIGAINEGQADVHSYILFDSPSLGEFFMNRVSGLDLRHAQANAGVTAQERFNNGTYGKEIHYMGGIWGAAWWTLRNRIGKRDSDKIFLSHLHMLQGSDDFRTALTAVIAANEALAAAGKIERNYTSDIRNAFQNHGITPSPRTFASLGDSLVNEFSGRDRGVASQDEEPTGFFSRLIHTLKSAVRDLTEAIGQLLN